jgi:hypothetical protein
MELFALAGFEPWFFSALLPEYLGLQVWATTPSTTQGFYIQQNQFTSIVAQTVVNIKDPEM